MNFFKKICVSKNEIIHISTITNAKNKHRLIEIKKRNEIIRNHLGKNIKVIKNQYGRPILINKKLRINSISISHNNSWVGVMFSNKNNCGFDIEKISNRIEKVKNKFCSKKELNKYQDNKKLTLIWTFKEAIYKYYSDEKLNFKNEILILSINNVGKAEAKVFFKSGKQKKISLGFRIIDNTVISYVKNEYPARHIQ